MTQVTLAVKATVMMTVKALEKGGGKAMSQMRMRMNTTETTYLEA